MHSKFSFFVTVFFTTSFSIFRMKVHEKLLTHYLSCTSPVDKEGYLNKKKMRTATFQRRWFVLKANLLFYQERPADRHLLGVIVLEGCAVRCLAAEEQFAFSLVFGPGLKTYTFAAENRQAQESWVEALMSASHCYLSLLVKNLEREYEEAKQQHGCRAASSSSSALSLSMNRISLAVPGPSVDVREWRSFSASAVLQAPLASTKAATKKSPKLWSRRNAYVTPLNGPALPYGEWSMQEFSQLHDYYGQEVERVREEWLKSKRVEDDTSEEDLIDLG
ncbi:sesquipedalian-1 isoform X1 [Oryzias melastigma]|uniref:sesquipedalian-1 isoform X1 n=1 Tax=Oryzias melastigma TaxID=30732 RepID=UPI000CF801B2|nr:sesquipedalian-1 isoform X1 [Oryzias melastigma]